METTVASGIEYTYNKIEISDKICATIEKIEGIVKQNNYQVTGEIDEFYGVSGPLGRKNFSKNQMKNIQKACYSVDKHPSLRRINSFLRLISSYFEIEKVKIKVSAKEEKIQKLRKEWLKARNESDRLLAEYKKEKGDFYKNKLVIK